jgi:hypothetical protein
MYCLNLLIRRDRLAMQSDPRSHTKRLCSCDLVWFRESFWCNPQEHTKKNWDATELRADLKLGI